MLFNEVGDSNLPYTDTLW